MKSLLKWLKFLNPANLILVKKIVDALDALVRLIEQLFGTSADDNDKPKKD